MTSEPPKPVLTDEQAFARKACLDFAARTTVLVVPRSDLRECGSGLLFRTPGGRPFLITAGHLVEDGIEPLRLMVPALGGRELLDAGERFYRAPAAAGRIPDVAVISLRTRVHAQLRPYCAGVEALSSDDEVAPKDAVFLVGFPSYLGFRSESDPREYLASTLTYFTGVRGRDSKGRLEVEWGEATPDPGVPRYPHLDVEPGKTMRLKSPVGVSGGGLWRVRGAKADSLWSPSSHAKLIGVPCSWDRDSTQYAESVTAWGPWLTALLPELEHQESSSGGISP